MARPLRQVLRLSPLEYAARRETAKRLVPKWNGAGSRWHWCVGYRGPTLCGIKRLMSVAEATPTSPSPCSRCAKASELAAGLVELVKQRRGDTALRFEVRLEYPLCEECSAIVDGIDAEMNRGRAPALKKGCR